MSIFINKKVTIYIANSPYKIYLTKCVYIDLSRMIKNIEKIKQISANMNKFLLGNNNLCVKRERKNDIVDALLFRLYCTKVNTTQEKVTIKLNNFRKNKKDKVSRQSLVKKEKKVSNDFYEKVSTKMMTEINSKFNFNNKYTKQVISVDGTYPTLLYSLTKDGYKANKKKTSVTPLVTGLYNITTNYPVMLDLVKDKNERKAFTDFIKNKQEFKNNIFLFDRGYMSDKLFNFMNTNELFFVCRIKVNSSLINHYVSDNICKLSTGDNVRIVNYEIDNKKYYIATNLFNTDTYSVEVLKQLYHERWTIEEYFKFVKSNMKLAKVNEKREISIKKTIMAHLLTSQLTFLFVNLNKHKTIVSNKIVNKSTLMEGIYDKFLYNFFKHKQFTKYFLLNFIETYVKFISTNGNKAKQVDHTCKRANYRWYFKNYFKNAKSVHT